MFEEQISRGATLLDDALPGWELMIDVSTLQLSSCFECVLGQLCGEYEAGLERLNIDDGRALDDDEEVDFGIWYGFSLDTTDETYQGRSFSWQQLTEEWVATIKARLDAGITI